MTKTDQTISLLTALGRIALDGGFQPLTDNDAAAFAGASEEARIAFDSETLPTILCEVSGETVMAEGRDAVAVIVSDHRVELHGVTPEGEPVAVTFDLSVGC